MPQGKVATTVTPHRTVAVTPQMQVRRLFAHVAATTPSH